MLSEVWARCASTLQRKPTRSIKHAGKHKRPKKSPLQQGRSNELWLCLAETHTEWWLHNLELPVSVWRNVKGLTFTSLPCFGGGGDFIIYRLLLCSADVVGFSQWRWSANSKRVKWPFSSVAAGCGCLAWWEEPIGQPWWGLLTTCPIWTKWSLLHILP